MPAIYLKKPSETIYKYLLKIQGETKSSKGIAVYSLEKTVYKIIEEHGGLLPENPKPKTK